jgi:hypothetical protein
MKDTTIAITANRFPYAYAGLEMDDRQRDRYAAMVNAGGPDFTPRQALYLASRITGAVVPKGAHR